MISVPAMRLRQFGVTLYQAMLGARDVDRLVRFEESLTRRYAGHTFEAESGLYDYGARRYDPALPRFSTPDPRHETPDPYAYCGNDPVNHVDPDGRVKTLVIVAFRQHIVLFDNDAGGAYVGHIADQRHVHGVLGGFLDRLADRRMGEHGL